MDFAFTPEEEAFRKEVQEFIDKEYPQEWRENAAHDFLQAIGGSEDEQWERHRAMAKKLGAKGWLSLSWPKEYGGRNSMMLMHILVEELAYHRCPGWDVFGDGMLAPMLLNSASEEQKRKYLPGIASGEVIWCEFLSERDAGSDLASLQTTAVEDGDYFVINGQKCWTTGAHRADWGFIILRTDPKAVPKHRGFSFFLLDMKTPGISITPIINMADEHEFNEVFFDNVRVPKENLLGEKNRGWYIVMGVLDFERSLNPIHAVVRRNLEELAEYIQKTRPLDPVMRNRIAELLVECEVARLIHYRSIWMQDKGLIPNYEAAMDKMYSMELNQRVNFTICQALGHYGELIEGSKWVLWNGRAPYLYLRTVGNTLEAGSSEVDRIVIAQRGLGLPRG